MQNQLIQNAFYSMEQKAAIYTYGNIQIKVEDLIRLLRPYNINCVVDCRLQASPYNTIDTPVKDLKETLKQYNIAYLPFYQHFGAFPHETKNKRGDIIYKKAILTESFLQGTERISNGVQKGYNICIIDNTNEIYNSKRYTLIGKFLKKQYTILHLYPDGHRYSQEQVELKDKEFKARRKQRINDAQQIGKTGEELAALYLIRNGYQILDHNWNLHKGCELDLVAMKDNKLHFIEVKTRTSDKYGEPQAAINYKKMKHILKAISIYRYKRTFSYFEYQIDSIAIIYHSAHDYRLKHFLNIHPSGEACAACHTYDEHSQNTRKPL